MPYLSHKRDGTGKEIQTWSLIYLPVEILQTTLMVEGKQLRGKKHKNYLPFDLPILADLPLMSQSILGIAKLKRIANFALPVALGLIVSGCVSTESSFLPTSSDLQLAQQNLPNGVDSQTDFASSEIQDGGIPVPDNSNGNLVAAYSAPATDNSLASGISASGNSESDILAASQNQAGTPAQILAGGIVGGAGDTNGVDPSLVQQTGTTADVNNVGNQTSLVAASNNRKKQTSFFSRLFKPAEPKKTNIARTKRTQPVARQEIAYAAVDAPAKKKQITEAKIVASAAATPLPNKSKTKKRSNVFTSLFGLKTGTDEDGAPEKAIQLASAAIGGLARLSPLALQRQTDRVDVACLKPELVRLLKKVEDYYKRPVIVTSGYRSPKSNKRIGGASGSKHTTCEAADVQVKGVSKWDIAKYVRSLPERGGVGTYCHTQSVHIDVGSARDWNWRCRKRRKK